MPARTEADRIRARVRWKERRNFTDAVKVTAGCADCGYDLNPAALDFDHPPGTKTFGIGTGLQRSWASLIKELNKCEVVCANCHRIRTRKRYGDGLGEIIVPRDTFGVFTWKS